MNERVDVLIVGAGLSGVGAAAHLRRQRPDASFLLLESRSAIGGTWDLFRYPGVRSDSDMFTLGYSFRPWTAGKAIADGASIREYICDTVRDEELTSHIRLNRRAVSAEWCSESATWTVAVVDEVGQTETYECSFLYACTGYYRYDEGFTPSIPGAESFEGRLVHPQHWPDDLDYAGKRVVVIGSGATAVTLVPAMARDAAHVTMVQRSASYIAVVPSRDRIADALRRVAPSRLAYPVIRAKNIGWSMFTYQLSRRRPQTMKRILSTRAKALLPVAFDVDTHLAPAYDPWDQRLCATPDADLFRSIASGHADIVTDRIERITPRGVGLASGRQLEADVIVTATGLNILAIGGMSLTVDGTAVALADTLTYKGMMLDGVPNFALTIGYTNASWTLKADLVARYVCRTLEYMSRHGYRSVVPAAPAGVAAGALVSLIDLKSGYVLRSIAQLPKQGAKSPWRLRQNYVRDFGLLRWGRITDDVIYAGRR